MSGRMSIAGIVLVAAALVGCSTSPYAKWKDLGAVYCNQVPLPGDAKFEGAMGGDSYGKLRIGEETKVGRHKHTGAL